MQDHEKGHLKVPESTAPAARLCARSARQDQSGYRNASRTATELPTFSNPLLEAESCTLSCSQSKLDLTNLAEELWPGLAAP